MTQSLSAAFFHDLPPDFTKLERGDIEGQRMAVKGSQLSMAVQTTYLVPHHPAETLSQIKRINRQMDGDGTSSATFGVHGRFVIPFPARVEDFETFQLTQKTGRFGFGGASMLELRRRDLNISEAEWRMLQEASRDGHSGLDLAWKRVFLERALSFQRGGLMAATPYDHPKAGTTFRHHPEWVTLLRDLPEVLSHFQSLIGLLMTGPSKPDHSPALYFWEESKVQGDPTFSLICLVSEAGSNNSFRAVECAYYVTGKYYSSMVLYDLKTVRIQNQEQTLVRRVDLVITPSIGLLRGIERAAAENIMLQEVRSSISLFLREN
ncbi:MAG: hypothetical protein ACFCUX_09570 [Candidatus Methylacidiphilales bacterium]